MAINYPLPAYHFQVEWGGNRLQFTEVSGLDIQITVNEYREGTDKQYHHRKMPGLVSYSNIILKRGIIENDNQFMEWINTVAANRPERRDIIIKLLDATHQPVLTWRVLNAFPVRYSGPVLLANDTGIAMEVLELAHEGIDIIV